MSLFNESNTSVSYAKSESGNLQAFLFGYLDKPALELLKSMGKEKLEGEILEAVERLAQVGIRPSLLVESPTSMYQVADVVLADGSGQKVTLIAVSDGKLAGTLRALLLMESAWFKMHTTSRLAVSDVSEKAAPKHMRIEAVKSEGVDEKPLEG